MNVIKQLIRQPVKLTGILIMLCAAGILFNLSFGVLLSTKATMQEIEDNFFTIALPTTEKAEVPVELGNGRTIITKESVISWEMWQNIYNITENCSSIKGIYEQQFISAWSPQLKTITSAREGNSYRWQNDKPYCDAMLTVTITEFCTKEDINDSDKVSVEAKAVLNDVLYLHSDYEPRTNLNLYINFDSRDEYLAANIEVGQTYIIYGTKYNDLELELRARLAESFRCDVDEINWEDVSYDMSEYHSLKKEDGHMQSAIDYFKSSVATYSKNNITVFLSQTEVEGIDTAEVRLNADSMKNIEYRPPKIDGTVQEKTLSELVSNTFIAPLETSAVEWMDSEQGAEWKKLGKQIEIQNQCVPVLGTDLLESIYLYQQQDVFITLGRSFEKEEYEEGTPVCIISELTAKESNLSVGDEISLSFYWGADPYMEIADMINESSNWQAQKYSYKMGFPGESRTYKIVGIYRQSNMWEWMSYNITPNTVFIPNNSLTEAGYKSKAGVMWTMLLKNGEIESVKELLISEGYTEDIFFYFDNGYNEISSVIKGLNASGMLFFVIAGIAFGVIMTSYILLFAYPQRRITGLMLMLGAGKKNARVFFWKITMLPVIIANAISAAVGMMLLDSVFHKIVSSVSDMLDTTFSSVAENGHVVTSEYMVALPHAAIIAFGIQMILYMTAIYICSRKLGLMVKEKSTLFCYHGNIKYWYKCNMFGVWIRRKY